MTVRRIGIVAVVVLLAACRSGTTDGRPTTTASPVTTVPTVTTVTTVPTVPTVTTVPTGTTVPSAPTVTTVTAVTTAPSAPTVTTVACVAAGTTGETSVGFPGTLSRLVGVDIRTGAHPCFERIVVEFASFDPATPATRAALPGYRVRYEDRPIIDSPRGEPVVVRGASVLVVSLGSWMGDMDGNGWAGGRDRTPTNVRHIVHLLQIENFEGMTAWAVGLDATYPYTVTTLDGPPRLVIDLLVS